MDMGIGLLAAPCILAQRAGKIFRIGLLLPDTEPTPGRREVTEILLAGLRDLEVGRKTLVPYVIETRAAALKATRLAVAETEAEVRTRYAMLAREVQDKALIVLRNIRPADLGPKNAIALLKLGLEEERKALGLSEMGPQVAKPRTDADDTARFLEKYVIGWTSRNSSAQRM